jgi:hypothetical protein
MARPSKHPEVFSKIMERRKVKASYMFDFFKFLDDHDMYIEDLQHTLNLSSQGVNYMIKRGSIKRNSFETLQRVLNKDLSAYILGGVHGA